MNLRLAAFVLLVMLPFARAPVAHHSFAAEFDYDLIGTIEGEVVEVLYVNPHARYFIEVTDEAGNTVMWDAQSRSPSALQRIGWTRDSIPLGEKITIQGNLGLDNTRKIWMREVTLSSGEIIRSYADVSEAEAED
jgi:hypothetical protein